MSGGRLAGAVHAESADIAGRVLEHAAERGDNLVLPYVGRSTNRLAEIRNLLQGQGYTVHLELVELPPDEAARRAVQRFYATGRFVDPDYVLNDVGNKPSRAYDILRAEGGFDSYAAYSNAVPEGQPPRFLPERSGPSASSG
ncbi:MAG: zeta toxin family protein [Dehalococcoidia bacterium]